MREILRRVLVSTGLIVVVAFAVRLAIVYFATRRSDGLVIRHAVPFGYEVGEVAAAIAEGRGFSSPLRFVETGPTAWFAPIYPYLLAGIFHLFGVYSHMSNLTIRAFDCAVSAFTVWPLVSVVTRLCGRKAALAAGWAWVFLPASVFYSVYWVWDTALAGFWMTLLVALTLKLRGSGSLGAWAGYGALWAVGGLINPSLLSVLPALALWAVWPLRQQWRRAAGLALASASVFLVLLAPWTIRNYVVFGKFIPLRSNFGLELWVGNIPGLPDGWAPFLHPNDNIEEAFKYAQMSEIPYMEEKQREALQVFRERPGEVLGYTYRRFVNNWLGIWDSPLDTWSRNPLPVKLLTIFHCLFAVLSWLGALFLARCRHPLAPPLLAVMFFFPLVFYFTHSTLRYRFPMDGVMLVLAVYAVAYPLSRLARSAAARRLPHAAPEALSISD